MGTLVGSVIGWFGYLLTVYGYSQVRGCNTGLRDLAWPGRTIACNPDGQATGGPLSPGHPGAPADIASKAAATSVAFGANPANFPAKPPKGAI